MHHRQISILSVHQTKKNWGVDCSACIETHVRTTHMLSSHRHYTNRRHVSISHYTTVKELRVVDGGACTQTHVSTTHVCLPHTCVYHTHIWSLHHTYRRDYTFRTHMIWLYYWDMIISHWAPQTDSVHTTYHQQCVAVCQTNVAHMCVSLHSVTQCVYLHSVYIYTVWHSVYVYTVWHSVSDSTTYHQHILVYVPQVHYSTYHKLILIYVP